MSQVRTIWCTALACVLGGVASVSGAPITDPSVFGPGVGTAIDFETDGLGNPVNLIAGEVRLLPAGEYSALGVTFDRNINWVRDGNPAFQAALFLGGSPRNAIPSAAVNEFEVIFTDPVQAFGFFVVHNSTLDPTGPTFTAFDAGGNVIETVTFSTAVPGGGNQVPNATFVRYGFLGIDAGSPIIKRVRVTKTAAILDDLTFAETLEEPEGACCVEGLIREDGGFISCLDEVTQSDCIALGGTFAGDQTLCSEIDCSELIPRGSCCVREIELQGQSVCIDDVTEFFCGFLEGVFAGENTICSQVDCGELLELGACCVELVADNGFRNLVCFDALTQDECESEGGVFGGVGSICDEVDCNELFELGACCIGTQCLDGVNESFCLQQGGVFLGVGTDCDGNPCEDDPTGACCLSDGSCIDDVTRSECIDDNGGIFQGPNTICSQANCEAFGACCFFDGSCEHLTDAACTAAQGIYRGDGTSCDDGACLGACCISDGDECVDGVGVIECQQEFEGIFQGFGLSCEDSECVGACCVGACDCVSGVDRITCEQELGGTYAGNQTNCDDPAICAPRCADANGDGRVDSIDLGILLAEFNQPAGPGGYLADFNCDGRVDSIDLGILLAQFGLTCEEVINGVNGGGDKGQSIRPSPLDRPGASGGQEQLLRPNTVRPMTEPSPAPAEREVSETAVRSGSSQRARE